MFVKPILRKFLTPYRSERFDWDRLWSLRNASSCPLCLQGRIGLNAVQGHLGSVRGHFYTKVYEEAVIKKPDSTTNKHNTGQEVKPEAGGFLADCPTIWEYITSDVYDDGSDRRPSQLSFALHDGMPRLALNDLTMKQSVYTQADSFDECLILMEHALANDSVRWYKWDSGKKKGQK